MPFPLRFNGKQITIPTSWQDVTLGQYVGYLSIPHQSSRLAFIENASLFTLEELHQVEVIFAERFLLPALSFLEEAVYDPSHVVPAEYHGLAIPSDIGECTYGQKADAMAALQEAVPLLVLAAPEVLAIYLMPAPYEDTQLDIWKEAMEAMPVTDALPIFFHLVSQLTEMEEQLKAGLHNIPYRDDELKAGVKELEKWGPYAIAYNLCGGDLLQMANVFELSVKKVHTNILYNNHRAWIRHRMEEEQRRKAEQENRGNRRR